MVSRPGYFSGGPQSHAPVYHPRVLIYDARRGGLYYNGQYIGISARAGRGAGYMNPLMSHVRNTGPPPMGTLYKIGPLHSHRLGQVMRLTPEDQSKMRATDGGLRDGFLIHTAMGYGSHGCIAVPTLQQLLQLARYIGKEGITHIQVINSDDVGVPNQQDAAARMQQPSPYAARQPGQQASAPVYWQRAASAPQPGQPQHAASPYHRLPQHAPADYRTMAQQAILSAYGQHLNLNPGRGTEFDAATLAQYAQRHGRMPEAGGQIPIEGTNATLKFLVFRREDGGAGPVNSAMQFQPSSAASQQMPGGMASPGAPPGYVIPDYLKHNAGAAANPRKQPEYNAAA